MQTCKPNLITLCLLISFPMVGAVTFTPALAELLDEFKMSTSLTQMTVAMYLGGYALGQLPYGWVSHRFGNHKAIYCGLALFALGSLMCAITSSMGFLMAGRAVMAIGAAVGLMMTFTLVSQFYSIKETRAILAYLTIALAIVPGIASAVGGFLTGFFGWKSCFYFLIAYAALVGCFAAKLPDSEAIKRKPFRVKGYVDLIVNFRFVTLTLAGAMTTAMIYVFASTAPLTAVYLLEVAPQVYGLVSFVPFIGTFSGCLIAAKLAEKISARRAIVIGLFLSLLGATLKLSLMRGFGLQVWTVFVPMPLIYFGLPFVYSNCAAICLSMAHSKSIASSLFCLANIGLSLLGVLSMGWMGISSLSRLPLVFLVMVVLMTLFYWFNCLLSKGADAEPLQVSES